MRCFRFSFCFRYICIVEKDFIEFEKNNMPLNSVMEIQDIKDYLESMLPCDKNYIVIPERNVEVRLNTEISARVKVSVASMRSEEDTKSIEYLPSAKSDKFVNETLRAIDQACQLLDDNKATRFELAFHNAGSYSNELKDRVLLELRWK